MKLKSFFERPEGKTGMVFIVIGVLAFLVAGNTIMPYVIMALQNTLHEKIVNTMTFQLSSSFLINKIKIRI